MRILGFGKDFKYVSNGEDAFAELKSGQYDLALLDNNMPRITGLELLRMIRNDHDLYNLPVILITGHAEQEFITHAAESDIDAYILKPITVNLIKEKIPPVIEKVNNPPPMMAHLKKAYAYEKEGNIDAALEEALMAMQENPNSTRPLRDIGSLFLKKGDLDEAEQYLLKAAKMNPLDVIAFTYLGDLYLKRNDIDNALKFFTKAMKLSPRHYERGLNLGKLLIQKNMVDKAEPVFNKVFELAKENRHSIKEEIADFCIKHNAIDYAARLLRNLVEENSERGDLMYKLGMVHAARGNQQEALKYYTQAEQQDDANVDIKLNIAKIYIDQGMLIRAEKPLRAVQKLDPDNKEAKELLRQCI
jgi:tetratricopeptide (TPR) repeat protein